MGMVKPSGTVYLATTSTRKKVKAASKRKAGNAKRRNSSTKTKLSDSGIGSSPTSEGPLEEKQQNPSLLRESTVKKKAQSKGQQRKSQSASKGNPTLSAKKMPPSSSPRRRKSSSSSLPFGHRRRGHRGFDARGNLIGAAAMAHERKAKQQNQQGQPAIGGKAAGGVKMAGESRGRKRKALSPGRGYNAHGELVGVAAEAKKGHLMGAAAKSHQEKMERERSASEGVLPVQQGVQGAVQRRRVGSNSKLLQKGPSPGRGYNAKGELVGAAAEAKKGHLMGAAAKLHQEKMERGRSASEGTLQKGPDQQQLGQQFPLGQQGQQLPLDQQQLQLSQQQQLPLGQEEQPMDVTVSKTVVVDSVTVHIAPVVPKANGPSAAEIEAAPSKASPKKRARAAPKKKAAPKKRAAPKKKAAPKKASAVTGGGGGARGRKKKPKVEFEEVGGGAQQPAEQQNQQDQEFADTALQGSPQISF